LAEPIAPASLLRGFIADLCENPDWAEDPRLNGYTSHGADERDLA